MFIRPVFKPHFAVHCVSPDTVVLLSETQHRALRGEFYYRMAPWLDGRTTDEVAQAMQDEATAEEIEQALGILAQAGFIQESEPAFPLQEAAFWSALQIDGVGAHSRLQQATVEVVTLGSLHRDVWEAVLQTAGMRCVAEGGDLGLVVADDYLNPRLEDYNRDCLKRKRPWLLVQPHGIRPWIGPMMVADRTGCWECLAQRLRFNRQIELTVKGISQDSSIPTRRGTTDLSVALVAHHAVMGLVRWLAAGRDAALEGRLTTLDLATGKTDSHGVVRRPQCAACGQPAPLDGPAQLTLTERPLDGDTWRAFTAEQTLQRYMPHVSRITGVVTELIEVPMGADSPAHVYNSGFNLARPIVHQKNPLGRDFRSASSGKGRSAIEAKAGALCEAIERYSSTYNGEEPRVVSSLSRLGSAAVHPNDCMLFSEQQYADREEWNAAHKNLHRVPMIFDAEAAISWTPVWSLSREETRYLPTSYCFYNTPMEKQHRFCPADSNGNAAGTTVEDAILQGFFELVERDAVALWWYNQVPRPGVNLDSFDEPYIHQLRQFYHRLGRNIWVIDITTDLEISAFAALSATPDEGRQILTGFGAHSNARLALLRALTEMNQCLSMFLELEQSPQTAPTPGPELTWFRSAMLRHHAYLGATPSVPARRASDYASDWPADARDCVLRCQQRVEAQGMEMMVLDQTRADVGMPVVKVVVPGLRHFWPRYAPGRLYDVPVKLGWLSSARDESALNPTPVFW